MDVETGEIKEFVSSDKLQMAMHNGSWIQVDKMPDPKCKKCYGMGHHGRNTVTNLYVPCRCVKRWNNADNKADN